MHNISNWLQRYLAAVVFIVGLTGFSAPALADTYNIILKQNGTPLDCATGGFEFTKDGTAGWKTPTSPSVHVNSGCITDLPESTFGPGSFNVLVQKLWINQQAQGLNVVGLGNGLVTAPTGQGLGRIQYKIKFSYAGPYAAATRNFQILKIAGTVTTGQTITVIREGTYFVRNTNALPEPEILLLLLSGAAGLILARYRKSHRKA